MDLSALLILAVGLFNDFNAVELTADEFVRCLDAEAGLLLTDLLPVFDAASVRAETKDDLRIVM